jgi:alkylation response protein AidB-like acyl-CoA dehydrogenase
MLPWTPIDAFLRTWVPPRAADLDQSVGALREALAEMGRVGILGLRVPREYGGLDLPPAEFRRFQEASARASGAAAFLESQHQSACSLIARCSNPPLRERLLRKLAAGEQTSGIAFSHLRRKGPPPVTATPVPGGFRLDGQLPWVTGWGLFSLCVTAAPLPDGRILFAVHPLGDSSTMQGSAPLELAAMSVTQTVTVQVRGFLIPEGDVLDLHPATWIQENDRIAIALQSPLALGCAQAGIDVLRAEARAKNHAGMASAADRLDRELDGVRAEAYRAMEERGDLDRGLRARAAAIELAGRTTHAAVIAAAGAGNLMSHPAQRVYREALAFSVLALSPPIQEAALDVLANPRRGTDIP